MKMNSTKLNSPTLMPMASGFRNGLLLLIVMLLASTSFAQLQVLEPSLPGISLVSNNTYTVRWARGGTTFTQVDIQYSSDGGATFTTLVIASPSTATDSSEAINVPGIIGGLNKIRVRKRSDNSQSDVSDNNFTITGFCFPLGMSCSVNYVEQVIFNTMNSSSTCNTNRGYVNYGKAGARTTTVQLGLTYPFKVRSNKTNTDMGWGVWADWNNDSDFADAGEHLYSSPSLDTTFSGNITIPSTISTGDIRFRVRNVRGFIPGASDYCTFYAAGGEIEDYTITISRPIILTNTFLLTPFCPGITFDVPFTTSGVFQPGNSYTAQLSLPNGDFTSATNIGFGSSSPISVTVPLSTVAGTYKIRVLSNNPAVFGQPSNSLTIKAKPANPVTTSVTRCGPGTVTLSASGCATTNWYDAPVGGNKVGSLASYTTPSINKLKDYYAQCVNPVNGCMSFRQVATANVKPIPMITSISPTSGIVDLDIVTVSGLGLINIDSARFSPGKRAFVYNQLETSFETKAPIGADLGPITVYTSCGSSTSSQSFSPIVPTIADPTADIAGGHYASAVSVTLSTATPGADIYYSLNGQKPIVGTSYTTKYSGPVFIGTDVTLKAIGYRSGWTESGILTEDYAIDTKSFAAKPTITPGTGSYSGAQLITISSTTPQAKIYFTVNGNIPIPGLGTTLLYQGPFTIVNPSVTIRAIAAKEGYENSGVAASFYTISGAVSLTACTFSPSPGIYVGTQNVAISNVEGGTSIYYTLDGTEPTQYNPSAQLYSGSVAISSSKTLKARAYKAGFGESPQTVGNYTIGALRKAVDNNGLDYYTDNTTSYGLPGTGTEFVDFLNRNSDQSVSIYPNPGTGVFFMDYGKGVDGADIQVINMMGQEVLRSITQENTFGASFDLSNQRPGFYIVRLKDSKGSLVEKKISLQ